MNVEESLVLAARSLSLYLTLDRVTDAILDAVERVFDARACWLFLHDRDARCLRVVVFRGIDRGRFHGLTLPLGRGLVARAFRERRLIFVSDAQKEAGWVGPVRVRECGLKSICLLPIEHGREAVGLIGMDSARFDGTPGPGPRDVELLRAFAAQAGIAICNARRYEEAEGNRRRAQVLVEERRRLRAESGLLREELQDRGHSSGAIVGHSSALREAVDKARIVAPSQTTVLLTGETGTGKEMIARLIHQESGPRAAGPFVAVNCAAIPEGLMESEMFGHERGAFTDAAERRAGRFEAASGGTIFLDEIGELPLALQPKLLRALQDGAIQRIGSSRPVPVDVRVIAATNRGLEPAVRERRFRKDLYYRLNVFPIEIPPLRERREDVPELFTHFVVRAARQMHKSVESIEPSVLVMLERYCWPGNVRELQNVAERAVILAVDAVVGPGTVRLQDGLMAAAEETLPLAEVERRAIARALAAAGGRVSGRGAAAELLGVKPTTLHARMRRLGVSRATRPPVLLGICLVCGEMRTCRGLEPVASS
ncbi:MAG: sigma 54-interacting transcriptional regulator [Vicinamibacterales bacterium]